MRQRRGLGHGQRAPYGHRDEVYMRSAERVMTDVARGAVVDFLAAHPQAREVIPGPSGLRKVRVPLTGRGERGSARVISFSGGDERGTTRCSPS